MSVRWRNEGLCESVRLSLHVRGSVTRRLDNTCSPSCQGLRLVGRYGSLVRCFSDHGASFSASGDDLVLLNQIAPSPFIIPPMELPSFLFLFYKL